MLQGAATSNDGSDTDMWAGYEHCSGSANGITRSLVKFDLSAIPPGTQITQATLSLYLVNSCDTGNRTHTVTPYRITSGWSETSVTWNTRPSFAEAYGSSSVSSQTYQRYTFDITNLVRGWVNGTLPNYGVMLRGPESSGDSSARLGFGTRNSSGTTYDPYINITYAGMAVSEEQVPEIDVVSNPTQCGPTVKDALGMFPDSSGDNVFGFVEQTVCSPD